MRSIVTLLALLSFGIVTPLAAQNDAARASSHPAADTPAAKPASKPAPGTKPSTENTPEKSDKKSDGGELLLEIQQLRQELQAQRALLRQQAEKMQALERQVEQQGINSNAPAATQDGPVRSQDIRVLAGQIEAVADSQKELGGKVSKVQTDLDGTKKSVEGKLKNFGPFNFSGDIRMRYEGTWSGNAITSPAGVPQHRERFRLRLNANAKFNDDISGGLTLVSGDLNNPVSANQSLSNFDIRKPIGIDRAFVTYQPHAFKPLSITAGKFAYSWIRTEQVWDNDVNPEGISESLHWNWKDSFFTHFGVVAVQSPVNTSFSGGGTVLSPTPSSAMFSGQFQTNWKLGSRFKLGIYPGFYHFRNPDQIAQNQTGGAGPTTAALGGNSLTNYVGTVGARRYFASKYDILDLITRLDFDTGIGRLPLMALFNFDQNTAACGNGATFVAAGGTAPFCDPRQRHAYWAELQFGRTQERGDLRLGYTFNRIERDAVLSAFNFDDKRQATNVAQHRLEIYYQAYRNVTVGVTGLIGRQLRTPTSASASVAQERFLRRFQLDAIYKF